MGQSATANVWRLTARQRVKTREEKRSYWGREAKRKKAIRRAQMLCTKLRDAGVCENCRTHLNLTIHHIIRKSASLSLIDFYDNLKVLCKGCHEKVEWQIKAKLRMEHIMTHAPNIYVGRIFDPKGF